MTRFVVRRLVLIPVALLLVNFLGYTYAHYALPLRAEQTPYVRAEEAGPLIPAYINYLNSLFNLDLGEEIAVQGPNQRGLVNAGEVIWSATQASLGLLTIAIAVSGILGLTLGLLAVRDNPPSVRQWLTWISTAGLAMPSFYIGSLFIIALVFYVIRKGPGTEMPLPIDGFGWDLHLVIPTIALIIRPTVQLAQTTAGLLTTELDKQYVVAARSVGHGWRDIRNRYALKNIAAPIFLMFATVMRILVGELILIEWLFRWPGLGRLLAWTLVPPLTSATLSAGTLLFLNPTVMATTLTIFAGLFLATDFFVAVLVRVFDPRVRNPESDSSHV